MASLDFPLSFIRQYPGPLDASAVFVSLGDLNTYIATDQTAYEGQIVSVTDGAEAGMYIIAENIAVKQANSVHTHTESDITDLDKYTKAEVDAKMTTVVDSTLTDWDTNTISVASFDGTDTQRVGISTDIELTANFDISFSTYINSWEGSSGPLVAAHFLVDNLSSSRFTYYKGSTQLYLTDTNDGTGIINGVDLDVNKYYAFRFNRVGSVITAYVNGELVGTVAAQVGTYRINSFANERGTATSIPALDGSIFDIKIDIGDTGTNDHEYKGHGNTTADWLDQVGSNHGTLYGTPDLITLTSVANEGSYIDVAKVNKSGDTITGTLTHSHNSVIWQHGEGNYRPVSRKLYSEVNIGTTGSNFTDVYGEADLSSIDNNATFTYAQSWEAVETHGARLPTLAEVMDGVGAGSGQSYDSEYIWTCTPAGPHHVWVVKGDYVLYNDKKIVDITDPLEIYRTRAFFDVSRDNRIVTHSSDGELRSGDDLVFHGSYHPNADRWSTTRTITMLGDVSSDTVNIDGSGNITLTNTVVSDDSHNHTIANVDGLQTALTLKADQSTTDAALALKANQASTYTKTQVDAAIAGLVESAPETLDTLNELAAALGDDPDFATSIATSIGTKADQTAVDATLALKANTSHTHAESDITDLDKYTQAEVDTALALKSDSSHTHSYLPLTGGTLTGDLSFQQNNVINRRFEMIENASPQYILLCINSANNDVNGTICMDRTSGNYQSAMIDVVISSGTNGMHGGTLRTLQVLQSSEDYRLVTCTYNSISYVAIKYSGNTYPETSGCYFSGRLVSTGQSLTVVASVTNESSFGGNTESYHDVDSFVTSGSVTASSFSGSGSGLTDIDADKLTTARSISLAGDVTGSTSFDGSGNVSITATVADDSHNHTIANVDGLQTALNNKADTTHNHNGVYEPADSTILKDADINSTVQGHNANTVIDGSYVHTDNNFSSTLKTKLDGISEGVNLHRIVGTAAATVGPGWITVAKSVNDRKHGEVIVSDSDSGDHAFIRIDWMRSYSDSNFTVINCGGYNNRITGVRVLSQNSDNVYGEKRLQVYVTTSSYYRVQISRIQNQSGWGTHTAVTPVIENSVTGYSLHGQQLDDLSAYGFAHEEGLRVGGGIAVGNGTAQSNIKIRKADNEVSDHVQFYNGTTLMGEIGCHDTTWLRINQHTAKNIYTPRYIRADGGFYVDNTAKGINGSGNFIGGTITGASDANVSNWDTAHGWGNHSTAGYITSFDITNQTDSKYLRSDANDTATGDITISKTSPTLILNDTNTSTGSYPSIQFDSAANQGVSLEYSEFDTELPTAGYGLTLKGSPNNIQFPSTGTLTLNVLGDIYAGGTTLGTVNKVLTTADEGSGNGLDADLLDGLHASSFLRSDTTHTHTEADITDLDKYTKAEVDSMVGGGGVAFTSAEKVALSDLTPTTLEAETIEDLLYETTPWTQIGSDIDGEAASDGSGQSVSMNDAGDIVAIGAYLNDGNGSSSGHVRVYQNIAGTWSQIGADIDGEASGDNSGYSVSMNAAGNIVAIGSTGNDGNGSGSGQVRIYANASGTWLQIGADINGEAGADQSGLSVSMNAVGNRVAIGAPFNDGNGGYSGHVRVYESAGGGWLQIGADIDGEASSDKSGQSVSINAAGDIVAIGAHQNDGNGSTSGHVRVYQDIAGTWTQIGADIDGEVVSDYSGYSVSINAVGDIVAIGAYLNDGNGTSSGHVRVYQNIAGTWSQIGADIDGEAAGDRSGWNVSINAAGNIVAIGAQLNSGNGTDSGHVRVYKNNAGTWKKNGADINGEAASDKSGYAVSMNSAGDVVAVSSVLNDDSGTNAGHVKCYSFVPVETNLTGSLISLIQRLTARIEVLGG
jgi:hypothetical protein